MATPAVVCVLGTNFFLGCFAGVDFDDGVVVVVDLLGAGLRGREGLGAIGGGRPQQ